MCQINNGKVTKPQFLATVAGAELTGDVSADLDAIANHPVVTVSAGAKAAYGYEADTGKELWQLPPWDSPNGEPNMKREMFFLANPNEIVEMHNFQVVVREARTEVRKVVWPTRKETMQTTGIVLVVVFLVAIMMWIMDTFFGWAVGQLLGWGS